MLRPAFQLPWRNSPPPPVLRIPSPLAGIADILTRLFIYLSLAKPGTGLFRKPTTSMFLSPGTRFVITILHRFRERERESWKTHPRRTLLENANYYRFDDSFQWSSLAAVGHRERRKREKERERKNPKNHDFSSYFRERESRVNRDSNSPSIFLTRHFSPEMGQWWKPFSRGKNGKEGETRYLDSSPLERGESNIDENSSCRLLPCLTFIPLSFAAISSYEWRARVKSLQLSSVARRGEGRGTRIPCSWWDYEKLYFYLFRIDYWYPHIKHLSNIDVMLSII